LFGPELVRQVLDRHPIAGEDQAAMVRDVCRGGDGVAVVVGRAGSGKTWALGVAREAFELAGYQVHGAAPTGIATVGLADEGFSEARTIDRLLLDLQYRRVELDGRSVLVVDEAAMVATRKLTPLLAHAERAGAKVVLVGDDRQFASIQAGGGFRAVRLRLGASELTVNRRQVEAWEQRAIEDVRAGNLEQAIAAYAEHDRIQAFEARDDRDRALVGDWWQAHQGGEQPWSTPTAAPRSTSSTRSASASAPRPASSAPSGWRSGTARSPLGMWWCWAPTPSSAWVW
jgi:ATP-dependent exoDNAse (exonuclease V) alpha subunit